MVPKTSYNPPAATSSIPSYRRNNEELAPKIDWESEGVSPHHILGRLETLYWQGVRGELENILITSKHWQQPCHQSVTVPAEEEEDSIHGFDTFIDQVSQESRAFATRYGMLALDCSLITWVHRPSITDYFAGQLREKEAEAKRICKAKLAYDEALLNRARDLDAEYKSSKMKESIREATECTYCIKQHHMLRD